METYRAIMLTRRGGPEVLKEVELPLRAPSAHQVRLRVRATGAGGTDISMRRGRYLFAPPLPFVPGYEVIGDIDALGSQVSGFRNGQRVAALTVHGGYAERILVSAEELVPVPEGVDDAAALALILNYVTAYEAIHGVARVQPGMTALVTGANGGVGSAAVELLRLHGVHVGAAASPAHHGWRRAAGATPIDARSHPLHVSVRALCPRGVDLSLDALGGRYADQCVRATRRGGVVVGYGFSSTLRAGRPSKWQSLMGLAVILSAFVRGRRGHFYGISYEYRRNHAPFRAALTRLFDLLQAQQLQPKIAARLPLLAAREANERLERGGLEGKIVHLASDLLGASHISL
jgi:NADPH2:quinone reductase